MPHGSRLRGAKARTTQGIFTPMVHCGFGGLGRKRLENTEVQGEKDPVLRVIRAWQLTPITSELQGRR